MSSYGLREEKPKKQGRSRGAKKAEADGYSFGSLLELSVYGLLKLRAAAGELEILQLQPQVRIPLEGGDKPWGCKPDFKCLALKDHFGHKRGDIFYVEAKGFEQDRWLATRRFWKLRGPARMEVWKGSWQRPAFYEMLVPISLIREGK